MQSIYIFLLATITTVASQAYPATLSAPQEYLHSHNAELQAVVHDALALEEAVLNLLEKYTLGAERIIQTATKLQNADLTPNCKARVLTHLNNRLTSQTERSEMSLESIKQVTSPNQATAKALQQLDILSAQATTHADAIETCIDNCDPATAAAFGKAAGQGGGAVVISAAKINCKVEVQKLRQEMDKSTARTRRAIEKTTDALSEANSNIGTKMTGIENEKERDAESKRNNDLNEYMLVKGK